MNAVNLGSLYASLELRTNRLERDMAKTRTDFDKLGNDLSRRADRIKTDLGQKFGELGRSLTIGLTGPIVALGTAAIKAATDMDSLKRGLRSVAGSSEETERQLARLREVAKLPGLGFSEAIAGSTRLQAAGLSAQQAEAALTGFGNALASVGRGKAELDGVITALSQIQSKGVISAEEINQIAERVPQIRKIMVDAFGTANTEILQKAKITSEEFINAVSTSLNKLPKVVGGAQNSFENFSDSAKRALSAIGDVLLPAVTRALDKIAPILENIAKWFKDLSPAAQTAFGGLALGGAIIGPAILGLTTLLTKLKEAKDAYTALNASGALGAAGAIGKKVAGAAGVAYLSYEVLQRTRNSVERNAHLMERERAAYLENAKRLGPQEFAKAQKRVDEMYPKTVQAAPTGGLGRLREVEGEQEARRQRTEQAKIDAVARAAAIEARKKATEEAKRLAEERRELLQQFQVDRDAFENKFKGMRTKAFQEFQENSSKFGPNTASPIFKLRLAEIDKEEKVERQRMAEAHKRRLDALKRDEQELHEARMKMRKDHADREKEAIKEITDGAVAEWRKQQERLRDVQEVQDRLFGMGATDEMQARKAAWAQYWKDFQVAPQEAAAILQQVLEDIDQRVLSKWAENVAAHFASAIGSIQGFLTQLGTIRDQINESVPNQVVVDGYGNVDTEARTGASTQETKAEARERNQREREKLREAQDRLRNTFGGQLAVNLADEFAYEFAGGIEKAFGRNPFGRALARTIDRWLGKVMEDALDSLFASIGKKGPNGQAGGLNSMQGGGPGVKSGLGGIGDMILGAALSAGVGSLLGGAFKGIGKTLGKIFKFDDGGIVPGQKGSPRLVIAHAGETILPTHKSRMSVVAAGGGTSINVNMGGVTMANDMDVSRVALQVTREIERNMRRNAPVRPTR